jgi:hypothetical protein
MARPGAPLPQPSAQNAQVKYGSLSFHEAILEATRVLRRISIHLFNLKAFMLGRHFLSRP